VTISIEKARGLMSRFMASEHAARGAGTTTALAAAAIATGGILVAATAAHADDLRRNFPGARIMSLSNSFVGMHGRFLLDHYAVQVMLDAAAVEVERAQASERVANNRADSYAASRTAIELDLAGARRRQAEAERELAELQARYDLLVNELRAQTNENLRKMAAGEVTG
jgi:hypothetical protein